MLLSGSISPYNKFLTAKFVNCDFDGCNLEDVDFSATVMSSNMLERIDFSTCIKPPKNHSHQDVLSDKKNKFAKSLPPHEQDE